MTDQIQTRETVSEQAKREFEVADSRPIAPEPPSSYRPSVVPVGEDAHLWVDVAIHSRHRGYGVDKQVDGRLFLVERRNGDKDSRIEGILTAEAIDQLIAELSGLREEIEAKAAYLALQEEFSTANREWESRRDEYVRQQVAAWQKEQQAKK